MTNQHKLNALPPKQRDSENLHRIRAKHRVGPRIFRTLGLVFWRGLNSVLVEFPHSDTLQRVEEYLIREFLWHYLFDEAQILLKTSHKILPVTAAARKFWFGSTLE